MQLQQHFGQHRPFYVQPSSCYETNSSTFTRHGVQEGFNWIAGMTRTRTTVTAIPPAVVPLGQPPQQQQQQVVYTTTFQASPSALHTMNTQQQQFNTTTTSIAPSTTTTTSLQPSMSHISQQQQQPLQHTTILPQNHNPYNQPPIASPYGLPSPTATTPANIQPQPYNTGIMPSQQPQDYNPYYNTTTQQPPQSQQQQQQAYQPYANLAPYPSITNPQQQTQQQIESGISNNQKNLSTYDLPPSYNESEEFSAPTQDQIGVNTTNTGYPGQYHSPYASPPLLQPQGQAPIIRFQYANDDEEERQQEEVPPPQIEPQLQQIKEENKEQQQQQQQQESPIQLDTPTPPPAFESQQPPSQQQQQQQQQQQEIIQQQPDKTQDVDEDEQMAALLMNLPNVPATTTTTTTTTQQNNNIAPENELVTQ
eukprot:UN00079